VARRSFRKFSPVFIKRAACPNVFDSAITIEYLQLHPPCPSSAFVYFYCSYGDLNKQNFRNFLSFTAIELMQKDTRCLQVQKLYDFKKSLKSNSISKVEDLSKNEYLAPVKTLSLQWEKVLIVVDAIDECSETKKIVDFARGLKALCSCDNRQSTIQILLTSRNGWEIEGVIRPVADLRLSPMRSIQEDIDVYLRDEVKLRLQEGKLKLRRQGLAEQ
jgi:hypothetical protein